MGDMSCDTANSCTVKCTVFECMRSCDLFPSITSGNNNSPEKVNVSVILGPWINNLLGELRGYG